MTVREDKTDVLVTTVQIAQVDQASITTIYSGHALSGTATSSATWQIKRVTVNSNDTVTVQYAGGSNSYTKVWDNRASYSYS